VKTAHPEQAAEVDLNNKIELVALNEKIDS